MSTRPQSLCASIGTTQLFKLSANYHTMNTDLLSELPASKKLGELSTCRPVVIIDSREQARLVFTRLPFVIGGLDTGDYSFCGGETVFSCERKSIQDLVACCGPERSRFERELIRLRGYRFRRLVIVGHRAEITAQHYRGRTTPKAILNTLAAFEARYDLPVIWCPTPEAAALQVESWVWWYSREVVKAANELLTGTKNPEPQETKA